MTDYEFPRAPEIEKAYRTAYKALAALVPPHTVTPEGESDLPEVLSQFQLLVDKAEFVTAGQLGPPVSWRAPRWDGDWELVMSGIDLDHCAHEFGDVQLTTDTFEGPNGDWHGSALDRAGLVYKRACGWDFPPGEAGVWLVMLAPVSASGGEDGPWFYNGRLGTNSVCWARTFGRPMGSRCVSERSPSMQVH
jgi:hypothetical protein